MVVTPNIPYNIVGNWDYASYVRTKKSSHLDFQVNIL